MLRAFALLALSLPTLLASPDAVAQWKWKDASGQVQYSDMPPPSGTPERDILQRPAPPVVRAAPVAASAAAANGAAAGTAAARPAKGVDPELEARRRKAAADEDEKRKADEARQAATRAENCTRARGYIRTLETGAPMSRVNDKGEREVLDDRTRADELRRAREVAASDCRN